MKVWVTTSDLFRLHALRPEEFMRNEALRVEDGYKVPIELEELLKLCWHGPEEGAPCEEVSDETQYGPLTREEVREIARDEARRVLRDMRVGFSEFRPGYMAGDSERSDFWKSWNGEKKEET